MPSLMFYVRRRDADAVIDRLRALVWATSKPYFVLGGDHDDVLQAARWGLAKAVRDWDASAVADAEPAFLGFARLCMQRELITAVKTAQRAKHRALNESQRLDQPVATAEGAVSLHELMFREMDEPSRVVIGLEEARAALRAVSEMTPLEREAVRRCLLMGERYDALGDYKRVDNAVQRARRKLAVEMQEPWTRPDRLRPPPEADVEFSYHVYYLCRTIHKSRPEAERTAMDLRWGKVIDCVPRRLLDGVDCAPQGRPRADGRRGVPVWRLTVRRLERATLREAA